MKLSPTLRSRFEANVNPVPTARGCLLWMGASLTNGGYGMLSVASGISRLVHHVAWFLRYGRWPSPAILHECDVRLCVNTDHMREGTKGDNNRDTAAKRRYHYGTNHHNGKLSDAQVAEIRRRRKTETGRALAAEFGVSEALISQIHLERVRHAL